MSPESIAFDQAAGYYDQTRGFPPGQEEPAVRLICRAGNLTTTSHVLEIGIGTGRIALPLAPHVHSVTGIDLARPMLARLRAKQTTEPIQVVEGDATQLPFPDSTFDAALAIHVFHLIPNWQDAVNEIARVLRSGAPLLVGGGGGPDFSQLREAISKSAAHKPAVGVQHDKRDTFLIDLGWQADEAYTHHFTRTTTPQTFIDWLENRVYSNTWRMTDDELAEAVAAAHRAAEQLYGDPRKPIEQQGTFTITAYRPPHNAPLP